MSNPILEAYLQQAAAYQMTEERMARIIETAKNRQPGLMVIMEDVHNHHNLAAIARSCDAFGIQKIAFTLEDETLFDPTQSGEITSASASKWLDYRIFEQGTHHALTTLKSEGWHIMATWISREAPSIYEVDFTLHDQLALLVGNEHAGLSKMAIEMADSYVWIPMMGMIQSFNVSVATAISLFEITRQRLQRPNQFQNDDAQIQSLIEDFIQRA